MASILMASHGATAATSLPSSSGLGHNTALRGAACGGAASVARQWNEQLLAAVRLDTARPTVHARNLYHGSVALYDAWAAYSSVATGVISVEKALPGPAMESERREAMSFAAYRVLAHRFSRSPRASITLPALAACMTSLGLDPSQTSESGASPGALGNRIGARIIAHGLQDGANEAMSYIDNTGYSFINSPMLVQLPGTGGVADINRWQPLIPPGASGVSGFLTPQWSDVVPFALVRAGSSAAYLDPGPHPHIGGVGDTQAREAVVDLIRRSAELDPDDAEQIELSPAVRGNSSLGTNDGSGYAQNPATGLPYPSNVALRGDWSRVLAEFWADGPTSSTPPGHWNEIAAAVSDEIGPPFRIGGVGPVIDALEWETKLFLALNGALHDAAIAAWEVKRLHDSSRPITLIREMSSRGQSSDPSLPRFDPTGLPLIPGLIEIVSVTSSAPGQRHEHLGAHIGEIAILAWRGHPADPINDHGGVGWILGESWLPYQQFNFVSPSFPGYVSGHSTFSRTAAEVLTRMTGSPYFPGGLGEFTASIGPEGFPLAFEAGPSLPVQLQWATYRDAADEAGISRIYGGIHPDFDDLPGRQIGFAVAQRALDRSSQLFGTLGAGVATPVTIPVDSWQARMAQLGLIMLLGFGVLRGGWLSRPG